MGREPPMLNRAEPRHKIASRYDAFGDRSFGGILEEVAATRNDDWGNGCAKMGAHIETGPEGARLRDGLCETAGSGA